jgi:hypothetical protein
LTARKHLRGVDLEGTVPAKRFERLRHAGAGRPLLRPNVVRRLERRCVPWLPSREDKHQIINDVPEF